MSLALVERGRWWSFAPVGVVCAGAALLPLAYSDSTYDVAVLPKMLAARLFLLLLGGSLLLKWLASGGLVVRAVPAGLAVASFVLSAGLSTLAAVNSSVALFGTYGRFEGFFTILTYGLVFMLSTQALRGAADARLVGRCLVAGGYVVALVATNQFVRTGTLGLSAGAFTRSDGTLGNANTLGMFLAMVLPLALFELRAATSLTGRLLCINLALVLGAGLATSFARSGWVAALVGSAVALLTGVAWTRARLALAAGLVAVLLAGAVAVIAASPGLRLSTAGQALGQRVTSLGHLTTDSAAVRFEVWRQAVPLVASRPVLGYGPDTFGLVFPLFQDQANPQRLLFDKAHSDVVQVAATQGLVGVTTYLSLLGWMLIVLWRRRARAWIPGALGALGAYIAANQVNFSVLPAALPFWILSAAAMVAVAPEARRRLTLPAIPAQARLPVAALTALAAGAAALPLLVTPYRADAQMLASVIADGHDQRGSALAAAARARALAPAEAAYAAHAGDIALDLAADGSFGPRADLELARVSYDDAWRLGAFNPDYFHRLALVDIRLGRRAEALVAARRAVELDRFDPASRVLLEMVSTY